jgi:hypothetical protein
MVSVNFYEFGERTNEIQVLKLKNTNAYNGESI